MTGFRPAGFGAAALLLAAALGGCANAGAPAADAPVPAPPTRPETPEARAANFAEWRGLFRAKALAAGIAPATFDSAFAGIGLNPEVQRLDRFQPEFTRPIWEYLDSAVSETRITNGRAKAVEKAADLARIEQAYQVDRFVVLAIWGLESAYGANYGSIPVIESLATLAYDGRRQDFAETQLLAALNILQAGDIAPGRMVGSWAGAMGHTQFIPTSFLDYAVDFTGDGRRDVWAADALDALASTANYLARFGWTRGAPAVVEVTLPEGFDYISATDAERRSASDWTAAGVRTVAGEPLPDGGEISILVPAGAGGPAFAAYPNFRVIKRYNNATSYALAVAHLAERIGGAPGFRTAWPRDDRPLSRSETEELQRRLTTLGYDTQGVDGIAGPNTRNAVRRFQQDLGEVPDGYLSERLLSRLRNASG